MALNGIIGQEKALRIFFGTLRKNSVPSAMLLSGDTGIGKRLAAINYAKAVNCRDPHNYDCCDKCPSCRKIVSGSHPDVIALFPEEDEIKIDDIRKLEEVLFLKPFEGRKKIVIIDDADKMNINAANAFLKTLEEPPPDSLILLITSSPDRLPDTIRSRCMSVRFYPLPLEGYKKIVFENIQADDMDAIIKFSAGRPGLAISGDFINERERFMTILDGMIHGEDKNIWADKNEMKSWFDMCFVYLRDLAVHAITGSSSDLLLGDKLQVTGNESLPSGKGAERGGALLVGRPFLQKILDAYQELQKIKALLDFNLNRKISWSYVSSIMRMLVADSSWFIAHGEKL